MPIKLFTDGEILDAAEVNTYFMDQALCIFDDETARDAAFGGLGEPILSEGRICYLKSDDGLYIYTGSAWTKQLQTIATNAVTETTILAGAVTETKIGTGAVTELKIGANAVTAAKIAAAVAGNGLAGGGGTALSVNVDSSTIEISSDSLRVKDLGITEGKIAASAVTSAKLGTDLTLSGATSFEEVFEKANIVAAQPVASNGATLTLTITDGAVYYYTTATAHNIVLDIVTTGLAVGQAATVLLMVTSGATTGKLTSIKTNGTTPTVRWFGGNAYPNGSSGSAVDAYTITVFRSSTAYTVFASQSKFA